MISVIITDIFKKDNKNSTNLDKVKRIDALLQVFLITKGKKSI